ncbi:MAG: hypothetical protein PVSMB4_02920 [Ktedonobacterales bacterium]
MRLRHTRDEQQRIPLELLLLWTCAAMAHVRAMRVRELGHLGAALARHSAARRRRERELDCVLRASARRSFSAAPPTLAASVFAALSSTSIAPVPPRTPAPPALAQRISAALHSSRFLALRPAFLPERRWRAALGGLGTLVLLVGMSLTLDPTIVFTGIGVASAMTLFSLALGHLLSAAVGAILGSTVLALAAMALYATLAVLWVHLVRRPVEA